MNPYLFPGLEAGPPVIERLIERVAPERMDMPTHPGRFTPREVIAHLADWEPIFLKRMKQCIEELGTTISGIDEGERAIEQKYSQSDWKEQMKLFKERRAETVAWLKERADADWIAFIVHNERGKQTLYDLATLLPGHDLYHGDQLSQVMEGRAVGTW